MAPAQWSGPSVRVGTSGGDTPVFAPMVTQDVDEARAYFRVLSYDTVSLRPVGRAEGFAFASDLIQIGPFTMGEISYGADIQLVCPDLGTMYHVLAPITGTMRSRHRENEVAVGPRLAGVYRPVGDIEMNWPGDCRLFSVRIDSAALDREVAAAMGRPAGAASAVRADFDVTDGRGSSWLALVRLFYSELRTPGSLVQQSQMARRWWQLTLSGLALALEPPGADGQARREPGLRPRTVKRTLDAMHADPGHPFTVTDLAVIAGVGARVLQEAFRRHVGMPPMTYLRQLRLAGVHEELTRCDPWQTNVSEVAWRWGFTHLGRFAGAYRRRYGVSPSQTLRERD
jgi:AraC-like DNA-binding protein